MFFTSTSSNSESLNSSLIWREQRPLPFLCSKATKPKFFYSCRSQARFPAKVSRKKSANVNQCLFQCTTVVNIGNWIEIFFTPVRCHSVTTQDTMRWCRARWKCDVIFYWMFENRNRKHICQKDGYDQITTEKREKARHVYIHITWKCDNSVCALVCLLKSDLIWSHLVSGNCGWCHMRHVGQNLFANSVFTHGWAKFDKV